MSNIYVASSWRNYRQPSVVQTLRAHGHDVYDFRNPDGQPDGFHWSEVDPNWQNWDAQSYLHGLTHPAAQRGFLTDYQAMCKADTFVLVLPCGRSAHLELGWAAGSIDKRTAILLDDPISEPELMNRLADHIAPDLDDLLAWLETLP